MRKDVLKNIAFTVHNEGNGRSAKTKGKLINEFAWRDGTTKENKMVRDLNLLRVINDVFESHERILHIKVQECTDRQM